VGEKRCKADEQGGDVCEFHACSSLVCDGSLLSSSSDYYEYFDVGQNVQDCKIAVTGT